MKTELKEEKGIKVINYKLIERQTDKQQLFSFEKKECKKQKDILYKKNKETSKYNKTNGRNLELQSCFATNNVE